MKKYFLSFITLILLPMAALADVVKIGMLQDFTETSEPEASAIVMGGELAIKEVSDSGIFLNGKSVVSILRDSTCVNKSVAITAAEQMIYSDKVDAIVGGSCSDTTIAILEEITVSNGVLMISPSATSPTLSTIEDNGLFFRTVPSDSRQAEVMAMILKNRGVNSIAVTYIDNHYGKGLADWLQLAYEASGGTITAVVPHKDGKSNYISKANELAVAGGELLVVLSYPDHGGEEIIRRSLDNKAFDTFMFPDGMTGKTLTDIFGDALNGSFGTTPGTDSSGTRILVELAKNQGFDATGTFVAETYDATALILLAMQSAGSTDSAIFKDHVEKIANAPGVKILPGELGKALQILADGRDVDYVGAVTIELMGTGEPTGSYREVEVRNGKFETVAFH